MDILFLIQSKGGKAKPTHILYGANLSHKALKENLNMLVANGFLKKVKDNGRVCYELTKKGYEFINESRRVKKLIEAFGIPV